MFFVSRFEIVVCNIRFRFGIVMVYFKGVNVEVVIDFGYIVVLWLVLFFYCVIRVCVLMFCLFVLNLIELGIVVLLLFSLKF